MKTDFDVVIAGGGYVGLSLAVALASAQGAPHVALVDAAPVPPAPVTPANDTRAFAITPAGRRLLQTLEVWPPLADGAQPVLDMIVTDSRLEDRVRPVFLTFSQKDSAAGEPLAHMVMNSALLTALRQRAVDCGVTILAANAVDDFNTDEDAYISIRLREGGTLAARLLVAADGVRSRLRAFAGIRTFKKQYGQSGIVTTVAHERPHRGRAEEHFLPAGPFAILPLRGNRSSLVWTETHAVAERLVGEEDFVFLSELERRFGHHLGALSLVGRRHAYPLNLVLARDFVRPRFALIGDAAHGIHPIAGQGLNLGFKDVAALTETLIDAHRLGLDLGAIDVLRRYEQWRRFDTVRMGVLTDVLNVVYANDNQVLRMLRSTGLGAVDRLRPLRRFFTTQASGLSGAAPKLLTGEPV